MNTLDSFIYYSCHWQKRQSIFYPLYIHIVISKILHKQTYSDVMIQQSLFIRMVYNKMITNITENAETQGGP